MIDHLTEDGVIADWMLFPKFLMDYPVGFTAKWTYTLLYNEMLSNGKPDEHGRYFVLMSVAAMAETLNKSQSSIKRALYELEQAGLIDRRRPETGSVTRTYPLIPRGNNEGA